jgi:flagellar basal body-associated protein FliL
MNVIAVVVIVIALIMSGVAAWGYNSSKDDEQKKKVYTGVGIFGLIIGIGGVVMMMMGGSDQKNAQADSNLPNNPKDLESMAFKMESNLDRVRSKQGKLQVALQEQMRYLPNRN